MTKEDSIAATDNLKRFVEAGGVLVVTQRSGVKDEANAVVNQRLPGLLAELCGVEVDAYDSLGAGGPLKTIPHGGSFQGVESGPLMRRSYS